MASINRKLSGCYRRVFIFLLVIVAISLIAGGLVYQHFGGTEGIHYWMAKRALNGVEKHLKSKNRPDGISEEQVVTVFENVREKTQQRQVDLPSLYKVLTSYQTAFHTTKPSTPEIEVFFQELEKTILKNLKGITNE
jgi:hypothetical protein